MHGSIAGAMILKSIRLPRKILGLGPYYSDGGT
jgi:hypothetical protein